MPYDVKLNKKSDRIENVISGTLSKSDIEKSTVEAIALQQNHGVYSVLVDASDLTSVNSVTDLYELPKLYVEQGASRSTRIAIVMADLEPARKALRFYENVCLNRGWTVQSFETQGEAEKWLASNRQ